MNAETQRTVDGQVPCLQTIDQDDDLQEFNGLQGVGYGRDDPPDLTEDPAEKTDNNAMPVSRTDERAFVSFYWWLGYFPSPRNLETWIFVWKISLLKNQVRFLVTQETSNRILTVNLVLFQEIKAFPLKTCYPSNNENHDVTLENGHGSAVQW